MVPKRYMMMSILLLVVWIAFYTRLGRNGDDHMHKVNSWITTGTKLEAYSPCTENIAWLEPYKFSYPIRYVSRNITAVQTPNKSRSSITVMDKPLFAGFTTVDLKQSSEVSNNECLPSLTIEVSRTKVPPVDASNIIFGLQTTIARLRDTVKHLARWLPHTGARLFAIVIENEENPADEVEMVDLERKFHALGMNVTIMHPVRRIDSFAQRYFSLVSVMYRARDEKTQWICCIDDDTFFPSMYDLQAMLIKYDTSEPLYLGSLSEDWWAVQHYGLMGFGGAGIFLSLPMASIIYNNRNECSENLRTTAGDVTVMDCIYRFSTVKLTHIPGLHQIDMHGDLSGFYESGREMLSLHHWKEGSSTEFKLEMEKMHLIADLCDSCFLQRWQFSNDVIVTNGFSISAFSKGHISQPKNLISDSAGMEKINLDAVEYTWNDNINVLHSLAPTRDKLDESIKTSYRLLDSIHINENSSGIRQIYFREGKQKSYYTGREMDTVIVLNWLQDNEKFSSDFRPG
ncbi:BgTH12-00107 [Blumeria graminis f. sp. triticale]|uniref:Bgt-2940 n=3 Tax=Blumeria graminis TaxID=34373 RepID=A0A381L5W6_BLUGR|nr:hypothetical protein BGT96224_2940 [Blumeria graminis f. sp. tritici 96224]CAD6504599.1 BgTH12-00107 [Blumeria graminis f. sp. triticale]VDB92625.1 Bgt-2940 [Blumeria graminis f. sp. tritici]